MLNITFYKGIGFLLDILMFRSVSNNCVFRDMCIARWLENLKEDLGVDAREDNIKEHLREK
jgi:hypothetical protein